MCEPSTSDTDHREVADCDGEKRPIDRAQEIEGILSEAAFLAEHIREHDPKWTREEQMDMLVNLLDAAGGEALTLSVNLEDTRDV